MAEFQLFLHLGWVHIWEGYDHLLFLAALILRLHDWKALLVTVSAFSIGHTAAMVASATGLVQLDPSLVEPAIALSIFAGALQNVVAPEAGRKWLLAGGFGLVHGAGFSTELLSLTSGFGTAGEQAAAFAGFLTGLEAGQVLFAGSAAALAVALRVWSHFEAFKTESSRAIAAAGLVLFVLRLNGGG